MMLPSGSCIGCWCPIRTSAPVGNLAFGHFHRPDFSKRELIDFVKSFAEKQSIRVGESSLVRDIDCLLRTYLPVRNGARAEIAEETFDCPLQELGLIQASPDGEFFRFAIGPKPSLPAAVFVFALDDYFTTTKSERNTMSVQECLYGVTNGPQSPGQAFKLDENSLVEYIEAVEDMTEGALVLDETAGLKQIYRRQTARRDAHARNVLSGRQTMKPATLPRLSDFIQVGARFLRSVNLEKDYAGGQRNGDYIVTPNARQVLNRVAEGLRNQSPYRAWTITGPYGVGKSAFAVFLTRLFCPNGDSTVAARQQLQGVDSALANRLLGVQAFEKSRKGFFPILITARRAATSVCILQGISNAISNAGERQFQSSAKNLSHLLRQAQRDTFLDSSTVVGALAEVNSAAINAGYSGVLLLIDELGKLFEFAARSPHKADVFLLQQLAEHASRSADQPLLLIGLLHQSFQDYGQHLDMVSRKEWAKIQGRYEDVAFLEPADQVIRMIASAIRWKTKTPDEALRKKIAAISRHAAECNIIPAGMRRDEFEAAAVAAYPLHPCTLVALPFLFKRFAQNERSLFSYLSSLEPLGFQALPSKPRTESGKPCFVRLEHLFDYFTQNFGSGLFRQPQARRWMEAADVLDRKDNLQPQHVSLVKSIGILNALGEFSPLSAREPVIHYALTDSLASAPGRRHWAGVSQGPVRSHLSQI